MQQLPYQLPDFRKAKVLVVGDVMLDRYWFGDTSRISPEAPVPIVKILNTDNRPGGAGNVALNIAALGANVVLLGLTGEDESAKSLAEQLQASQVTHDFCTSNRIATIIKLRIISKHQQLLRLDFEEKLTADHTLQLKNKFTHHLKTTHLVILSDYGKGTLTDPQDLIHLASKANVPVLVDPKGTNFHIYRGATIVTPNFKEFEAVVGQCRTEEEILDKGRQLLQAYQFQTLVVTRGEDGVTLITAKDVHHMPALAREVFDVTGAGDTVISTLGSALAAGSELKSAAALANIAAGIAVGKFGAATVSPAELQVAITGKTDYKTGMVTEEELINAVKQARANGKKIVFTNGCFDVLHAGHVCYLQMAKQLGDYLIVAVNHDESIRNLKGPNRPVNCLDHRMRVLEALAAVDWVVSFADETPNRLLKLIKPDLLVKGDDYSLDQVVGAEIVKAYGGEVRVMGRNICASSSNIIQKIQTTEIAYE